MDCVNIDCKGAKKMQLRKFKGALSGPRQVFATESPLKMMKNALYFTSKALFVLKILKFLSGLLVMRKSGLRKKVRLISKFVTQQSGKQTITIHILPNLPNISRNKGNQTLKFGQLIECNMRGHSKSTFTQCRFTLVSYPLSKKVPRRLTQHKISIFSTQLYVQ